MNNEILITEDFLHHIVQNCESEILAPCLEWLDVKETKYSNYWDCSDFLTTEIIGVERVDKIQLVSMFMLRGKITFLADFCNYVYPIDLWNKMRDLKLIEENEYRFLCDNWKSHNSVTRANL